MRRSLIALMLCCGLLTGCGGQGSIYANYREIEKLLPVQTMALDSANTGLRLGLSCAGVGDADPTVLSGEGEGILSAMASARDHSASGELYYDHAEFLLLGEDCAKVSLADCLDFLARDGRMRLGLQLFVAKGRASELMDTGDISESLSAIGRDAKARGSSPPFTARETLRRLSESGAALISALAAGESGPEAEGYAIIRDGALVGYLAEELCPTANILLNRSGSAGETLDIPGMGRVATVTERAAAKIRPRENSGVFDIDVKIQLSVGEIAARQENITARELLEELESAMAAAVKQKIRLVLEQSRELEADFLGLGRRLDDPPEDWLKNAQFRISVEARAKDTGDLGNAMEDQYGK